MAYKYPKISNCLGYKKYDEDSVVVTDYITEDVYLVEKKEAKYMRRLDGKTNPYKIRTTMTKAEIDELLDALYERELIKESKTMKLGGGMTLRTIWEPKWTSRLREIAFWCNNILLISWLPVLIIGIFVFYKNLMSIEFELTGLGTVIGILTGVILHEFGHAFAGVSYGARVFEMGVLTMYYVVPGAYVIMDRDGIRSRLKRVQINAAGVEMNMFLTGLFLILGVVFGNIGGLFLAAAIQNFLMGVLNLTFIPGLDGMAVISDLLGISDVAEKATKVVASRKKRKKLMKEGLPGKATVMACYIFSVFRIALPLLLILNVLEVIICFV